jgi:hypothetical protein
VEKAGKKKFQGSKDTPPQQSRTCELLEMEPKSVKEAKLDLYVVARFSEKLIASGWVAAKNRATDDCWIELYRLHKIS